MTSSGEWIFNKKTARAVKPFINIKLCGSPFANEGPGKLLPNCWLKLRENRRRRT